uniref:Uncharacterized protein n=2 Tax=Scophthalmus maximus TaxID=52904 RepID=A0A8D3BM39_SCOMX
MNILIVFALPCYMATLGRGAPLPGRSALVEEPRFQELVQKSRSLTEKILGSVPAAHESCVRTESFKLNSSENAHLAIMAANIGILPAPVLRAVSENVISKTILTRISEGLQLHRALLSTISGRLQNKDQVTELMADIRDLDIQINKVGDCLQIKYIDKSVLHLKHLHEIPPFTCLADAEDGPRGGCGAAHPTHGDSTSTWGIRGPAGGTPDSGAAPVIWAGHSPLPQESGQEQRRGDGELANWCHTLNAFGFYPPSLLWHLFIC